MDPYRRLVRPALFRLDPERAHEAAISLAARVGPRLPAPSIDPALGVSALGLRFPSPIGLAAGFDKGARAIDAWAAVGFGFAEVGTVTPESQPGNPRPRMFRLDDDGALINRLGFNNPGAAVVASRLAATRARGRVAIPIGVNVGKGRDTPAEDAKHDYAAAVERLWQYADYIVVNVSSPNTPGLRELQARSHLAEILRVVHFADVEAAARHGGPSRPLLVKLAPDLEDAQVDAVVDLALELGLDGLVVANTTLSRSGLRSSRSLIAQEGGLSGRPLCSRSTELVRRVAERAGGALTIVGVGGISSARDAWEKLAAGASLVQLYTGLVYEGPTLVHRINRDLVRMMRQRGIERVADIPPAI